MKTERTRYYLDKGIMRELSKPFGLSNYNLHTQSELFRQVEKNSIPHHHRQA